MFSFDYTEYFPQPAVNMLIFIVKQAIILHPGNNLTVKSVKPSSQETG